MDLENLIIKSEPKGRIKAVIFDMDGVIIDSEPLWRIAMMKVFAGVGFPLTDAECASTQGLRIDEVVDHWYRIKPWKKKARQEVVSDIIEQVQKLIMERGEAMPGFRKAVGELKRRGYKLAIASSSSMKLILTVVNKLSLADDFEQICSAEHEAYGKPHPDIFLKAASLLGILPEDCLVIEDSFNGLIAAKAARMKCLVVPEKGNFQKPEWVIAEKRMESLEDFDPDWINGL